MRTDETKQALAYDNILVDERGIAEVHGRKLIIFVPAAEVEHVAFKFGRSDHRPVFSVSAGIALALIGIAGLIEFFRAMQGYRYELGMMAFGIIGGSMIFDSFKERYFLEVRGKRGVSRLTFSKNTERGEIEDFCNKLRTVWKYPVTTS